MRTADCKPFCRKNPEGFSTVSAKPPGIRRRALLIVMGFIDDPKMAQGLYHLSSIAASFFYAFSLLTEVKDGAGHQHKGQLDARRQEKLR